MENALQNIASMYAILMSAFFLKILVPYSVKTVNDLVFFLFLPVTIVYSISGMPEIQIGRLLAATGVCIFIITVVFLIAHLLAGAMKLSGGRRKTFGLASAFGNYGFLGIPLSHAAFGEQGLVYGIYFFIGSYIFLYTIGYFIMSGRVSLAGLVKNPLVLATGLGLIMLSLGIEIPAVLKHPMSLVNSATFPLSMVVVGGGLSIGFLRDVRELGRNLSAVLLKLILSPIVAYLACLLLSLPLLETGVCMLQASMPTGVLVTVFSIKYKGDETLSNALISMSTLASIITIPAVTALAG